MTLVLETFFLDEATTALDSDREAQVYEILARELPNTSIVSISHKNELERFRGRTIEIGVDVEGSGFQKKTRMNSVWKCIATPSHILLPCSNS